MSRQLITGKSRERGQRPERGGRIIPRGLNLTHSSKGKTDNMKAHVYQLSKGTDLKQQYTTTTKMESRYTAKNMKYFRDLSPLFENLIREPSILPPRDPTVAEEKSKTLMKVWEKGLTCTWPGWRRLKQI